MLIASLTIAIHSRAQSNRTRFKMVLCIHVLLNSFSDCSQGDCRFDAPIMRIRIYKCKYICMIKGK